MDIRVDQEKKRILEVLKAAGVPCPKIDALEAVIDNAAFMRVKLEDCQAAIKSSNVVIPYDNGGGQKGLRENPLFKGYEALFKSYILAMDKIMDALPKGLENELQSFTDDAVDVIEMVKSLKVKSNDRKPRAKNKD